MISLAWGLMVSVVSVVSVVVVVVVGCALISARTNIDSISHSRAIAHDAEVDPRSEKSPRRALF